MLDRHKHAIEENDMLNWLKDYEKLMTEDERNRYWNAVRQIVSASVELLKNYLNRKREKSIGMLRGMMMN